MALTPNEPEAPLATPEADVVRDLERPRYGPVDLFRERLTTRLLWLFGGTVAADIALTAVAAFTGHDASGVRDGLHDVIPAETGLLGAAIGYYFGERSRR